MNDTRPPKLLRRQEKMASMMRQIIGRMERSIQTGEPCFHSPEMQAVVQHFEADRVRVEQFINEGRDRAELVRRATLAALRSMSTTVLPDKGHRELMAFAEAVLIEAGVLP